MKYIKNESRYALTYTYMDGVREMKVDFDRLRRYRDTGNIATTGITAVEDNVYEALQENKSFLEAIKRGELALTEPVKDTAGDELEKLRAENEKLQKKLNKNTSTKELEKAKEEKAKLAEENASLKVKLESLAKDKNKKLETETEGF